MTPTDDQTQIYPTEYLDWDLEGSHSGALLQFKRLIGGAPAFKLIILQHNDPSYRDKVFPHLNLIAKSPGVLRLDPETGFPEFEEELASLADAHDVVQVVGLEQWLAGQSRLDRIRGFNYHREYIAERCKAVIALWMLEDDIRAFALESPDMWAWRSGVIDFTRLREPAPEIERLSLDFGSADLEERRERIKEIEGYLASHSEKTASRANLLRELGRIQVGVGALDAALKSFEEAASCTGSSAIRGSSSLLRETSPASTSREGG